MVDHQAALVSRFGNPRPMDPEEAAALARLAAAPTVPRDASTVVLLRDAPQGSGIEAYMLRRTTSMAFAAGMYVFPGGRVDPADGDDSLPWAGPPVEAVMPGLDTDPARARALVCAAVRETFEECGVLLTSPVDDRQADQPGQPSQPGQPGQPADVLVAPGPNEAAAAGEADALAADRRALESRQVSFAELLTRRSLALRADLIAAWARWVAPELERRRYDTRFFVAAVPAGQQPGTASSEADGALWVRPAYALDRFTAGEMAMLPPTACALIDLAAFDSVAAVLAAAPARDLAPVMPEISIADGRWRLLFPHLAARAGSGSPTARTSRDESTGARA